MAKPSVLPVFDTNGTNTVPTPAGRKTDGYPHGSTLPSAELNYLLNLLYQWVAWGDSDITEHEMVNPYTLNGGTIVTGPTGEQQALNPSTNVSLPSRGSLARVCVGRRLKSVKMAVLGDGAADLTWKIQKQFKDATVVSTLATQTIVDHAASWGDVLIRFDAHSTAGLSITVDGVNGKYTRASGDYLAEGYYVGQQVTWAGLANSGNNVTQTITTLTPTVMTVLSNVGMVSEGPTANATVTAVAAMPVVDDTFRLDYTAAGSASGLFLKALRYTFDNPT